MSRIDTAKQLARPSGVVVFAAAGQAMGGLVALVLAYRYADTLSAGGMGVGAMLLIVGVLGCGLMLLPTHVLSLLCGWALGVPAGLAVALAGATGGAPLGYIIGRWLAGPGLMSMIDRYPQAAIACKAITSASPWRAMMLVGLLRLSPVVPYGSTNVLAAAFNLPMRPFILGTVLGLAPRALAAVIIGAGLERLDEGHSASPWMIGLGLVATVLALVLMSWAARRALRREMARELEL